jgi:DNA-binding CsgD family transcriptional regulator/GAF domain-containing protein
MPILTETDFRDVMAIHEATQRHGRAETLQHEILAAIETHLAAPSSLFLIRSHQHWIHDFDRVAQRGLPEVFVAKYLDGLHVDDPLAPHIRDNPRWRFGVLTTDAFVSPERWTSCGLYRELLHPYGIHHMLGIELVADGVQIGLVGLFRPQDAEPFSQRDVHKAALCSTAIANSLDRALETEEAFRRDEQVADAVSALTGVGFAVLDDRLRLVFCTREARDVLVRLGAPGTGQALPPELHRRVAALQRRIGSIPVDQREALEVSERLAGELNGHAIDVRLRCVNAARGAVRYVMTLKGAMGSPCEAGRLLELGLTRREAEIVQLVVGGLRNADIAERLCVSINTVQTHLRSIFDKLGVRNRASLMLRVFSQNAPTATRLPPGRRTH